MKSEQVIAERLKSAKQEHDVYDILLKSCDKSEREGLLIERAKLGGEVKTLEWILEPSFDNDKGGYDPFKEGAWTADDEAYYRAVHEYHKE